MKTLLIPALMVVASGCGTIAAPTDPASVAAEQSIIDEYGASALPACSKTQPIAAGRRVRVTELPGHGLALVFVDDQPYCMDSIHEVEGVLFIGSGGGPVGSTLGAAASGGVDPMPARQAPGHADPMQPGRP
jgi:hypothetical protein